MGEGGVVTILDKAKVAADRARDQARHGTALGRARIEELRAQRQRSKLLQQLGEAYYAEHAGKATQAAVVDRLAALDAHTQATLAGRPSTRPGMDRQARDIMHAGAECIGEDDSVAAAAQRMRDLGVGSLPICGADDRLHGILTDRDIVVNCIAEGGDPAQIRVGDLAEKTVFWVDAGADLGEVLHQMEDHQVKRLPVIENHRLVGIISEADLARTLDEHRLAEFVERVYATS
jgi:CBS domain-containing protein